MGKEKSQSPQDKENRRRIRVLEALVKSDPRQFNYSAHNDLRHLYTAIGDEAKAMKHADAILARSIMDDYTLRIVAGWQSEYLPGAVENLVRVAESYKKLPCLRAACLVKAARACRKQGRKEEAQRLVAMAADLWSGDEKVGNALRAYRAHASDLERETGSYPPANVGLALESAQDAAGRGDWPAVFAHMESALTAGIGAVEPFDGRQLLAGLLGVNIQIEHAIRSFLRGFETARAARKPSQGQETRAASDGAGTEKSDSVLRCSFCGKNQDEVQKLIAGPAVYICDECIDLCNAIMAEEEEAEAARAQTALPKGKPKRRR